jgi:ankyrin repeat protein/L-ascorbate metabolism protein UlaG (beta-lactamase superfamily)
MRPLLTIIILIAFALPAAAGDIHRAIETGDLAQVTALLDADPQLANQKDESQYQDLPLHVAAAVGNIDIARLLIDKGATVDGYDSDQSTPLHVAAIRRQGPMVTFLVSQGADLAFQDDNGGWSMSFAASAGDSTICRELMDAGAPLDLVTGNGSTLLHLAVRTNMAEVFDRALAAGVDPNATLDDGYTVLHFAAMGGQIPMIERLLASGADVNITNEWGSAPLIDAAWRGQTEAAVYLLDHGANINVTDDWGRTPLWVAAGHGEAELVGALLDRGADADRGNDFGLTPLLRAVGSGHSEIVGRLLDAGARVDTREARTGGTSLHAAAMRGYGDVVERLAAATSNMNACNAAGETALDLASRYGNAAVVAALSGCGARQADPPVACPAEAACLATCAHHATDDAAPATALALGDCKYWYLGHSGYAFQTRNHLLIFDYWSDGREPDAPALSNGYINPAEIADQNVTVFMSHEHGDHFDADNFAWAADVPNIRFYTGCPAETDVAYELLAPRTVKDIDGLRIHTIDSNDSGLGFLVEVDGLVILHPGDHANRQQDFSGPYCGEIDWLAANAPRPDIAVMPVSGCGFGDLEAVRLGVHYVFETLQPRLFLPAHSIDNEWRYDEFITAAREEAPGVRMVAPDHRGDHFTYSTGRDVASR